MKARDARKAACYEVFEECWDTLDPYLGSGPWKQKTLKVAGLDEDWCAAATLDGCDEEGLRKNALDYLEVSGIDYYGYMSKFSNASYCRDASLVSETESSSGSKRSSGSR